MSTILRRVAMFCLIGLIAVLPVVADETSPNPVLPQSLSDSEFDPCPQLPQEAVTINYRILQSIHIASAGGPSLADENSDPASDPLQAEIAGGQIIATADEYHRIFGVWTDEIDWDSSRIVVFEEFTSYKLGDLDSDTRLSGIYDIGDSLLIHTTHTNYGPCQGIRQLPEWFAFEVTYLLIVVPREPRGILYSQCRVGDCPPDIP